MYSCPQTELPMEITKNLLEIIDDTATFLILLFEHLANTPNEQ